MIVHFERPTEQGFDPARCELPEYKWIFKEKNQCLCRVTKI